jgi:hypothetical protein
LTIMVQPPSMARVGSVLIPSLAVKVTTCAGINGSDPSLRDLDRIWAFATLIDGLGEAVECGLQGMVADSAHSLSNEAAFADQRDGYFLFDNLSIQDVGVYRIRITLVRMDSSGNGAPGTPVAGAASLERVESRRIRIVDSEVPQATPSK